jgi:hypothetical protein
MEWENLSRRAFSQRIVSVLGCLALVPVDGVPKKWPGESEHDRSRPAELCPDSSVQGARATDLQHDEQWNRRAPRVSPGRGRRTKLRLALESDSQILFLE